MKNVLILVLSVLAFSATQASPKKYSDDSIKKLLAQAPVCERDTNGLGLFNQYQFNLDGTSSSYDTGLKTFIKDNKPQEARKFIWFVEKGELIIYTGSDLGGSMDGGKISVQSENPREFKVDQIILEECVN